MRARFRARARSAARRPLWQRTVSGWPPRPPHVMTGSSGRCTAFLKRTSTSSGQSAAACSRVESAQMSCTHSDASTFMGFVSSLPVATPANTVEVNSGSVVPDAVGNVSRAHADKLPASSFVRPSLEKPERSTSPLPSRSTNCSRASRLPASSPRWALHAVSFASLTRSSRVELSALS